VVSHSELGLAVHPISAMRFAGTLPTSLDL
jgi:hypothetical protein